MKNAKQPAQKKPASKTAAKRPSEKELSEEQLEHVVGGAVDAFLKIGLETATISGVQATTSSQELSEDQLEHVAGGAGDMFLKFGDLSGETGHKNMEELTINAISAVPQKFNT
jgi:hypothetical protein